MKHIIAGIVVLTLTGYMASAQNDTSEYDHRPFQFTFLFPPLSTNGVKNTELVNNISLNLFLGVSGGVEGFEAGTFLNINRYYMRGGQLAGFGNTVGGPVSGFQGAGFINISGNSVKGAQLAGFANVAGGSLEGFQGAGFLNISGAAKNVVQAAGFGNVAGEGVTHFQGAGFLNVAREVKGVQAAGFINMAKHVEGVQIASFLNICDSIDGVPLGFINIVKYNGYRRFSFSVSETQYANFTFRLGVRELYSIYSIGKPFGPLSRWMFGGGFGTEFDLGNETMLNVEGTVHQEFWTNNPDYTQFFFTDRLNMYQTLKFLFGWNMDNQVTFRVGPTFNVSVADTDINGGIMPWHEIPFYSVYNRTGPEQTNVQMWFGLQGSISF